MGDGYMQLKRRTFNHLTIHTEGPPPEGATVTTQQAEVPVHTGACSTQTNTLSHSITVF